MGGRICCTSGYMSECHLRDDRGRLLTKAYRQNMFPQVFQLLWIHNVLAVDAFDTLCQISRRDRRSPFTPGLE